MTKPLVSTIIPVFNRSPMLRQAVQSVLEQDYRPIEIIIVDDGSTDTTAADADALAGAEQCISVIHQENAGPGVAREAGRRMARGAYLQYLDSDDLLLPGKFARQVRGMEEDPGCGASYGWTRLQRTDGSFHPEPWKATGESIEKMFPRFLQSRWWETATPLYRAEVCRRAGPWSALRMEEDWEYDCRMAALDVRLHYVADWVSVHRRHDQGQLSGTSESNDRVALRDRARAHELILQHARTAGIPASAPEMQHFARELFLLSRLCGAVGLDEESRVLFRLSGEALGEGGMRLQRLVYRVVAGVVGWTLAGRLARLVDLVRARIRGEAL